MLTKLYTSDEAAVKNSFVIAHKIAKNSEPFSEGEFTKECLADCAFCPEKKETLENVSLSSRTMTRQIENIANNLELQLHK